MDAREDIFVLPFSRYVRIDNSTELDVLLTF